MGVKASRPCDSFLSIRPAIINYHLANSSPCVTINRHHINFDQCERFSCAELYYVDPMLCTDYTRKIISNSPSTLRSRANRHDYIILTSLEQLDRVELKVGVPKIAGIVGHPRLAVTGTRLPLALASVICGKVVTSPAATEGDVDDLRFVRIPNMRGARQASKGSSLEK
jgi:hypothetical protein